MVATAGYYAVFLDVSESSGLVAGVEWERELYRKLRSCGAFVAIWSASSLHSRWCFAELAQARASGKPVFPVRLDDTPLHELLGPHQSVDLRPDADHSAAFRRLCAGLERAGIVKGEWDSKRSPFPGLLAFDESDHAVFFGREEVTEVGLSRLAVLRQRGSPRWMLLLGASGCGKSSVLRAGLLPRIRADRDQWLPVGPVRPGGAGVERLAHAFSAAFEAHGVGRDWRALSDTLRACSEQELGALASDLRAAAKRPEANLLVVVDQLEELFSVAHNERTSVVEADTMLRTLRSFSEAPAASCFVIATLRSDFLGPFQQHPALRELASDELILKPLATQDVARVIEGPAQLASVALGSGLVDQIVRDTQEGDALPLLAFTLRELYEQYGGDRLLELAEYHALGGLQQAIAKSAEEVMSSEQRRLPEADRHLLKGALLSLVRLSEDGLPVRRRVPWESFPVVIQPSLEMFVRARLLVARAEKSNREIEVAHEAFFRAWPRMREWIEQKNSFLTWRRRIETQLERWQADQNGVSLLSGPELEEALGWLAVEVHLLSAPERAFVAASRSAQQLRTRIAAAVVLAVVAALAVLAVWALRNSSEAHRQRIVAAKQEAEARRLLSDSYSEQGRNMLLSGQPQRAIPYLIAARDQGLSTTPIMQMFAASVVAVPILTLHHEDKIVHASFSSDGGRIVTAGWDHVAKVWNSATGELLMPPLEHARNVSFAAFSKDSTRILTVSWDDSARVWDAATGKPLAGALEHRGEIFTAVFSNDGSRIVTASRDNTARIWDAATGKPLTPALEHHQEVCSATFSSDGALVVTASWDHTARVWDSKTGKPLTEPFEHEDKVRAASFSGEGGRIVTASDDGTARVWDVFNGQPLTPWLRHDAQVDVAVFSSDGKRVVTASVDGAARVWDGFTGAPVAGPLRHGSGVHTALFSDDGKRVVTASDDQTVRIWDAATGTPLTSGLEHGQTRSIRNGPRLVVEFGMHGDRIVTAGPDNTARVWNVSAARPLVQHAHDGAVRTVAFSQNGGRVVSASRDKTAHIWDPVTGVLLTAPLKHDGEVNSALFSADGARVVTASADGTAVVWNAATGKPLSPPLQHGNGVGLAVFSSDGQRVATASSDSTARVWSASTGRPLTGPIKHQDAVVSVTFSNDGTRVVTASFDATARVWDAATGEPRTPSLNHEGFVWSASFSMDGRRVVTSSVDHTARIWDAATGRPLTQPLRHDGIVWTSKFSKDGERVVTASSDNTARVWDASTGKPVTPPLDHHGPVRSAEFSRDGTLILTASEDGTARVWDAATGRPLTPPLEHEAINGVALSADGTLVGTASHDSTVRLWPVAVDVRSLEEWKLLAHCFSYVLANGVITTNSDTSTCPKVK